MRTADQIQIDKIERRRENTHVMLVEVLQNTFPLRKDKFSVEVLPVVSASFPQKPLSVACQGGGEPRGSRSIDTEKKYRKKTEGRHNRLLTG